MSVMMVQTKCKLNNTELFLKLFHIPKLETTSVTVDKIYYLRSLFVLFTNFSFQIYFSTAENRQKNRILWQLAKIRLE